MVCPGGVYHDTLRGVTIREIDRIHITVAGGQLIAPEFFGDILDFARHQPLTRRR